MYSVNVEYYIFKVNLNLLASIHSRCMSCCQCIVDIVLVTNAHCRHGGERGCLRRFLH
jgi:hypothetical protein